MVNLFGFSFWQIYSFILCCGFSGEKLMKRPVRHFMKKIIRPIFAQRPFLSGPMIDCPTLRSKQVEEVFGGSLIDLSLEIIIIIIGTVQ